MWKKFPLLIRASIYEDNQPLLNQVLAIKRFNTLECVHLDLDFCLQYDIAFPTILNTLAQQTPVPVRKLFMDLRLFSIQRDAQFIDYHLLLFDTFLDQNCKLICKFQDISITSYNESNNRILIKNILKTVREESNLKNLNLYGFQDSDELGELRAAGVKVDVKSFLTEDILNYFPNLNKSYDELEGYLYLQEAQDDFDLDEMEQGNELLG